MESLILTGHVSPGPAMPGRLPATDCRAENLRLLTGQPGRIRLLVLSGGITGAGPHAFVLERFVAPGV